MPLPDWFWAGEKTPLLHNVMPGRFFLDVHMDRRNDWPVSWSAENIWEDPDLRGILLAFYQDQTKDTGFCDADICVLLRTEKTESGCQVVLHGGDYLGEGSYRPTPLMEQGFCKRTTATREDAAWLLNHLQPDPLRVSSRSEVQEVLIEAYGKLAHPGEFTRLGIL